MSTRKFRRFVATTCIGLSLCLAAAPVAQAQTGCVLDQWNEVAGGGITTGTGPAAVVLGKDLYVFVTGGADRVFSNKFTAATTTWSGWSEVPAGAITGGTGPAAAVYRDTLYLFVLGPTGHVFVNSLSPAGWSLWSEVPGGGIGAEGLAAASFQLTNFGAADELDLFVRGLDGDVWINSLTGTAWSGWSPVPGGGVTIHGPAVTSFGNLYLYVRGIGGGIFENIRNLSSGNWSGWFEVSGGGNTTAAPGVAAGHFSGILLGVRGLGSRIYRNQKGPGSDGQWTEFPGNGRASGTAGPALVVYQNSFQMFASGPDDRIYCIQVK